MLVATTVLMLCASPVKIAASGFIVNTEDTARAVVWVERFAEVMRRDKRLEVTTAADIAQLLGVERQKQLMGCDSNTESCMAELASALGAEGTLIGSITHTGDSYLAVVKVIRQRNGSVWWSASGRMTGEPALLDWLDQQAQEVTRTLFPLAPLPVGPLVVGGVGVIALGIGATMLVLSNTTSLQDAKTAMSVGALSTAIENGRAQGTVGVVLLCVGGAALATAIIWGAVVAEVAMRGRMQGRIGSRSFLPSPRAHRCSRRTAPASGSRCVSGRCRGPPPSSQSRLAMAGSRSGATTMSARSGTSGRQTPSGGARRR